MMLHVFNSKTKKIKNFLDSPPPKKRLRDSYDRDMATCTSLSIPAVCDLDFH